MRARAWRGANSDALPSDSMSDISGRINRLLKPAIKRDLAIKRASATRDRWTVIATCATAAASLVSNELVRGAAATRGGGGGTRKPVHAPRYSGRAVRAINNCRELIIIWKFSPF